MIICLDNNGNVLWTHRDNEIKRLPEYVDDPNVITSSKDLEFPDKPDSTKTYYTKWDFETEEFFLVEKGLKPKPPTTNDDLQKDTSTLLLAQVDQFEQGLATKQDIQAVMLALADIHMMLNTSREV